MRVLLVCLLVGCGSAPKPGTSSRAGSRTAAELGIRADRVPVEVRQLERTTDLAPAPVEYVPALRTLPYWSGDIDDQLAMRKRLLDAEGDSAARVDQLLAIAGLYMQKLETNQAERTYILAANEPGFPKHKLADETLFRIAMSLRNRGELVQARKFFYRLIKDYPASDWIADSYLQFGDYFFDQDENDKAAKFYEKAVQLAHQRTSGYAHYKLGWSYLRDGQHQKALGNFVTTLQQNFTDDKSLRRAALRGFVFAYPEIGRPDRAYQALRRLDADAAGELLALLGEVYADKKMHDQSVKVFDQLAKLVDDGKANGVGVSEAFSALARSQLEAGRTGPAKRYLQRFPDVADAGEIAYYLADAAWQRAAQAQDMGVAADLWGRTAELFERAVDLGGLEGAQIVDAEAAATVARSNARAAHSAANR